MAIKISIYRNNKEIFIPIQQYLNEYHNKIDKESQEHLDTIGSIIDIRSLEDYKRIYDFLWIHFNYHLILIKYEELQNKKLPFDDDIIRLIAFLHGTDYFEKIGYPELEVWLNAKDHNHPFEKTEDKKQDYSLMEVVNYNYGQNAIRDDLLYSLKWLR